MMSDQLSSDLAALKIARDERPEGGALKKIVFWLAALGGLAAVGWFVVYPRVAGAIFKKEVQVTEISLVSPAQGSVELTSTGYVVPQRTSRVAAKITGRIVTLDVKENQPVRAGQLIARLDDADQKSAIAAAQSRVAAARARAQTARAQLAETRQQVQREQQLAAKGVTPQSVVDDLVAREKSLAESVKAADADVRAAEAEVATLKLNLEHTEIVAPIDGTVIAKNAEVGELVGPQTVAPIVEIADFSTLVVETDVPEGRLGMVKEGGPCEIVLDAYPGKRYRGETLEISKRVNRAKATVEVKVKFVDDMTGVLPDMSARVSFLTEKLDEAAMKEPPKLVVPKSAVVDRGGAKVVFVLGDGGAVRMTAVALGPEFGGGWELKQGPGAGTRVVANPPADLTDGMKVKEKDK
jgi:RND family efflux transporter MFP subunit